MRKILLSLSLVLSLSIYAQDKVTIQVKSTEGKNSIPREIYGQFAEHLGTCIYGGVWVGEDSPIPNTNGYRNDVLKALKDLKVPIVRWPGGCFADEYHWKDGIGPKGERPKMINTHWGGTIEDNSFGTHEFLNFCELIGAEPYVNGNVGSGTVEEMEQWVEYMTSNEDTPMANLRRENGRDKAWKVKYFGVGNESWGCGGNMRPEYYSDLYRRFATYCRNYSGNELYKIACGASDYDYDWTKVLMENVGGRMHGLSLHYYTVLGWSGSKGSATKFDADDYYWTLGKCREIEDVLVKHIDIMDKYDPKKRVGLIVDEWGTWWDEEPGTISGHLNQQNTLRDAFVASLSFDIFHKYTDRIQMTNIAQMVNVLQSMILTKDEKMTLTPTYHVFRMYNVHQDATYLPIELNSKTMDVRDNRTIPLLSATASKNKEGVIHISLSNVHLTEAQEVVIAIDELKKGNVTGEILVSNSIDDHNTFDNPNKVAPKEFKGAKFSKGNLVVKLPAKSIVTLAIN